jgi:hypothetical protein
MKVSFEISPTVIEIYKQVLENTVYAVKTWGVTVMVLISHAATLSLFVVGLRPHYAFAMFLFIGIFFYTQVVYAMGFLSSSREDIRKKLYPLVYLLYCDTWKKKLIVALIAVSPHAACGLARFAEYIDRSAIYVGCTILIGVYLLLPVIIFFFFNITIKE